MSGVNLDALSDEQLDAMITGCRLLRTMRAPYLDGKAKTDPSPPAIEADSAEQSDDPVGAAPPPRSTQ